MEISEDAGKDTEGDEQNYMMHDQSHLLYFLVIYTLKLCSYQVEFHPNPHK